MIGDDIQANLPFLREQAASLMVDTVSVSRRTPDGVAIVWTGPSRVQRTPITPTTGMPAEIGWAVRNIALQLPVAGTEVVADGDIITITSSLSEPALTGLHATVIESMRKTHEVFRRVACQQAGELTDVIVRRTTAGTGDGWDTPVDAVTEHVVPDCQVGPRSTSDPTDFSNAPQQDAALIAPPDADIESTDTVVVPASHRMAGTYQVNGRPGRWPLGVEVQLTWAS